MFPKSEENNIDHMNRGKNLEKNAKTWCFWFEEAAETSPGDGPSAPALEDPWQGRSLPPGTSESMEPKG